MNNKDYKRIIRNQSLQLTPLELEYGYEHNDIKIDKKLSEIINNIVVTKPIPMFYAKAWENAFIIKSKISQEDISAAIKYFSNDDKFILKVTNRLDSDILFAQIYRAKCLFDPLILIENQKFVGDDRNFCFPDSFSLNTEIYRVINIFSDYTNNKGLNDTLSRYVSEIKYDRILTRITKTEITRAQFAIIVMILSNMPNYEMVITLNKSKMIMTGLEIKKPTKILTHVLCCIVYNLLQRHATNARLSLKGYCRSLTAEIVTYISPKDENKMPYSSISPRSVQVALTGK